MTRRISESSTGGEANGPSNEPSMSSDGRFVAFASGASDLVENDTNGQGDQEAGWDVFVRDRDSDMDGIHDEYGAVVTVRVSVQTGGFESHGVEQGSRHPSISDSGRLVAFASDAPDLVPGDTNGVSDVFVHDLVSGVTTRVSVASNGVQAQGASRSPALSGSGRAVAFESEAENLVAGDSNGWEDVFLHDLVSGKTGLLSHGPSGNSAHGPSWGPAISDDGDRIAFTSIATDLVADDSNDNADIFIFDGQAGSLSLVSVSTTGERSDKASNVAGISGNGTIVSFNSWANLDPADLNSSVDIYIRDLTRNVTLLASLSSQGEQADATTVLEPATAKEALSRDGRFLVFESWASNLEPGSLGIVLPDVYLRDFAMGATWRVSTGVARLPAPGSTFGGAISADGKAVAFWSNSPLLTLADANLTWDVFVRSRSEGICLSSPLPCAFDR